MKRITTLILGLCLVLSLTACFGNTGETARATEAPATAAPETVPPPATEAPVTETTAPVQFGWSENIFEKQIPQPPFSCAPRNSDSDTKYVLQSLDSEEISALELNVITGYASRLKAIGFNQVEQEIASGSLDEGTYRYRMAARRQDGWYVGLEYTGTSVSITLVAPEVPQQNPSAVEPFDTSWAKNEFQRQIPKPPFTFEIWERASTSSTQCLRSVRSDEIMALTLSQLQEYGSQLQHAGFNQDVREYGDDCRQLVTYTFFGTREDSWSVRLESDGMGIVITISAPYEQEPAVTNPVTAGPEGLEALIPDLPMYDTDGAWTLTESSSEAGTVYRLDSTRVTINQLAAYARQLRSAGYTENDTEYPGGTGEYSYYYTVQNAAGVEITIAVVSITPPEGKTILASTVTVTVPG